MSSLLPGLLQPPCLHLEHTEFAGHDLRSRVCHQAEFQLLLCVGKVISKPRKQRVPSGGRRRTRSKNQSTLEVALTFGKLPLTPEENVAEPDLRVIKPLVETQCLE